jgi:hypothetical protein
MDLIGIVTFIGVFLAIVLTLISIGYYVTRESTYEDMLKSSSLPGSTESVTHQKKKTSKTKGPAKQKKTAANPSSDQLAMDQPEEEPIVIIPDPFTNQLNSNRFAGVSNSSASFMSSSFARKDKDGAQSSGENVRNRHGNKQSDQTYGNSSNVTSHSTGSHQASSPSFV